MSVNPKPPISPAPLTLLFQKSISPFSLWLWFCPIHFVIILAEDEVLQMRAWSRAAFCWYRFNRSLCSLYWTISSPLALTGHQAKAGKVHLLLFSFFKVWSMADLQRCGHFCCAAQWLSYMSTCIWKQQEGVPAVLSIAGVEVMR